MVCADQFVAGQAERLAVPLEEKIEHEPADGRIVVEVADQPLILAVRSKHGMDISAEVGAGLRRVELADNSAVSRMKPKIQRLPSRPIGGIRGCCPYSPPRLSRCPR